jgi:hypothetical protein
MKVLSLFAVLFLSGVVKEKIKPVLVCDKNKVCYYVVKAK